jgi:hypothetical protein
MKRIILLTCAVAAVMMSTVVRSQNAGAPSEPLLKTPTPTAISAPAAIVDPAVPVPAVTDAAPAKKPAVGTFLPRTNRLIRISLSLVARARSAGFQPIASSAARTFRAMFVLACSSVITFDMPPI